MNYNPDFDKVIEKVMNKDKEDAKDQSPKRVNQGKRFHPNEDQKVDLIIALRAQCRIDMKDGKPVAVYNEGWSDEKIAETVNLPLAYVKHKRHEKFGALEKPAKVVKPNRFAELVGRVERLEAAIGYLIEQLGDKRTLDEILDTIRPS